MDYWVKTDDNLLERTMKKSQKMLADYPFMEWEVKSNCDYEIRRPLKNYRHICTRCHKTMKPVENPYETPLLCPKCSTPLSLDFDVIKPFIWD